MLELISINQRKLVRKLHQKKYREQEGAFLVEGERLIDELNEATADIHFVFGIQTKLNHLQVRFPTTPIAVIENNSADLFATEHAQGVGAVVSTFHEPTIEQLLAANKPLLYLDALSDPGNIGTIIRTADWFGVGGILLGPGCSDLYNPKTVRATMGSIFRMPVLQHVGADEITGLEVPLFVLDGNATATLGATPLPQQGMYVIGNEAHGVSECLRTAGTAIAIAGHGMGESLNAAIAASIVCYELSRGAKPA